MEAIYMEDDLFVGPEPEQPVAPVEQEPEKREAGSSAPVRKKPGRGRPRLEDVARRKTAERVARWRAKQNNPVGVRKVWETNLANLAEPERQALLAKAQEVAELT